MYCSSLCGSEWPWPLYFWVLNSCYSLESCCRADQQRVRTRNQHSVIHSPVLQYCSGHCPHRKAAETSVHSDYVPTVIDRNLRALTLCPRIFLFEKNPAVLFSFSFPLARIKIGIFTANSSLSADTRSTGIHLVESPIPRCCTSQGTPKVKGVFLHTTTSWAISVHYWDLPLN